MLELQGIVDASAALQKGEERRGVVGFAGRRVDYDVVRDEAEEVPRQTFYESSADIAGRAGRPHFRGRGRHGYR